MIYSSPRLARAYAEDRPPVHARVLAAARLPTVARALDIGCGAGLSTRALLPYAERVTGVDPSLAMLAAARVSHSPDWPSAAGSLAASSSGAGRLVAGSPAGSGLRFVAGRAEHLPFRDNSFELVAAGGSMNYADLGLAVPEVHRVLAPGGTFVLMDFSEGSAPALEAWWREFASRYPFEPGYEMARWDWLSYTDVPLIHSMTLDEYLRYVLSEVNVEELSSAANRSLKSVPGARLRWPASLDHRLWTFTSRGMSPCIRLRRGYRFLG